MKNIYIFLSLCLLFLWESAAFSQSDNTLWYVQPANYFEETLVLGNGKVGASIFGGVESDKIFLNDATLWSGEPVNPAMNSEAYKYVPLIREALKNEHYALADSLSRFLQGSFSESFAPLGTMFINVKHDGTPKNYYRELDISRAVSKVTYETDGVKYTREYFISHPDQVMAIKLSSSKKGALSFDINFESLLEYEINTENDHVLRIRGYAPYHTEPSYRGDIPDAVLFDPDRGTRFSTLFSIQNKDGSINQTDHSIGVTGASEAVIYVSIATSFNGYDKNPATEGADDRRLAENQLKQAMIKPYADLIASHLADYQYFFNRVELNLGTTYAPNLPTDERLKRYTRGGEDKNLEILYFQYGRYLLISSSRTAGAPANLQGIWNPYLRPPWSSNYTLNINAEENYWLAENANLSEMHLAFLDLIKNISKTGAVTAKTFYGVGGWTAAHNSDIWAMSNPVGDFGQGDPVWANWTMGGAWLSTHMWEHYSFSQDIDFLRTEGYPILKGASQFCLEWLIEDENGFLITSPSTSPENKYITPDGYIGATLYGATADLAMIRECFSQTVKAAKILDTDSEFSIKLERALDKLYPYQIGSIGNLQEWYYDWKDAEPKHRHQSHLFGLYPGHQISPGKTPKLADACRKTLEIKGDETTGWSKGWRINLWARLLDGNRAYKMYRELLHYVEPDGVKTDYARGGGTYPNLFDAHPPFQIDGNFGGAAAVVEMLVQSDEKEIILLPALPDVWANGALSGACARGGFEIDMEWENKTISKLSINSVKGGETTIKWGDKEKLISLKPNEKKEIEL